jgi:hypothetical protein
LAHAPVSFPVRHPPSSSSTSIKPSPSPLPSVFRFPPNPNPSIPLSPRLFVRSAARPPLPGSCHASLATPSLPSLDLRRLHAASPKPKLRFYSCRGIPFPASSFHYSCVWTNPRSCALFRIQYFESACLAFRGPLPPFCLPTDMVFAFVLCRSGTYIDSLDRTAEPACRRVGPRRRVIDKQARRCPVSCKDDPS